jgi:hypothetical protein
VNIAVLGFGKSFLAWNLAGCFSRAEIYADANAPYRVWNRSVRVVERAEQLREPIVFVDHEEPDISADAVLWSAAPDNASVLRAMEAQRQHHLPFFLILNGYSRESGVPWPFQESFAPILTVPWDERSATCPKFGKPLTQRDPKFRARFQPLWEVMGLVDLGRQG